MGKGAVVVVMQRRAVVIDAIWRSQSGKPRHFANPGSSLGLAPMALARRVPPETRAGEIDPSSCVRSNARTIDAAKRVLRLNSAWRLPSSLAPTAR